jgi:hypothetical protein
MGLLLTQWIELDDWHKDRWIDHETRRVAFSRELLDLSKSEDGKTYLEQYIPIILSLHN